MNDGLHEETVLWFRVRIEADIRTGREYPMEDKITVRHSRRVALTVRAT